MTRRAPLCRNCGMPMKGHSKSGCLVPNVESSPGTSFIPSTPSFVIPATGLFRRQNPNYTLPPPSPPPKLESVLSSASLTPTEPVLESIDAMKRSFPSYQQFTPDWSQPSSAQPTRRVLKAHSTFILEPPSLFDAQPDSARCVAVIYQIPTTTVESYRTRALSNGIYCVPIEGPLKENILDERMEDDDLEPSTWIVTGPRCSDVDTLVAILRPRGLFWRILHVWPTAMMQVIRLGGMGMPFYGNIALSVTLFICAFKFIFKW